ncbi:hAT transposon superfamily [Perilla frutescens var. hirtella]|uniref:HAT transposon superfamily n=1 Tax=Perilla frutescens var. hirtella TaxID=608512 RepID=A0AAD4IVB0_PERFH|nr:hAT transposon superfamily [Perilla frutescens var. hirtella]
MVREKDICWEFADRLEGNKVRCKFCERVLNGGISRLKHHLSRLPSKGVNPCTKVRDDVSDKVREIITSKDDSKETSTVKKQKLPEFNSPLSVSIPAGKAFMAVEKAPVTGKVFLSTTALCSSSRNDHESAERSIALFFFENRLDFSVARSSSYQQMIDAVRKCGSGFVGPSAETLKTTWLEKIKSECMNGILEEFCNVDWISRCILQAQVVSKYIYNNSSMLLMMRKFTGGQDIIRSGITDSVSNFLSLQSMLKQKSRLKHMFNSPEFSTSSSLSNKPQAATCVGILDDNEFWRAVEESVAVSEPFLKVMREVSGGKPAVGFIYELMTRAKESIRTYYIMDEIKCKTFLDIVDKHWQNNLHSPLHSAAAFLNPSIQYNPEIKFFSAIKEDFYTVLEKLLPTPDHRHDLTNQILLFSRGKGMFGCNLAKEAIDTVSPGIWWEQFGDAAPTLQRVAIRILSQVCSTSTSERQWSTFQQIHSEKRNKIDKETLNDLLYIYYNLKLDKSLKSSSSSEADTLQLDDINMTSEWVEETENPSPVQWLDRFGSALEGGDLNTRHFNTSIFGANDHIFNL